MQKRMRSQVFTRTGPSTVPFWMSHSGSPIQELQTADNEFLHLIKIDIPRTFPDAWRCVCLRSRDITNCLHVFGYIWLCIVCVSLSLSLPLSFPEKVRWYIRSLLQVPAPADLGRSKLWCRTVASSNYRTQWSSLTEPSQNVEAESDAQPSEQRQKCLFRILKAYANLCPDVGYCQILMSFHSPEMITLTKGVMFDLYISPPRTFHPVCTFHHSRCRASYCHGALKVRGWTLSLGSSYWCFDTEIICRGSFWRVNDGHTCRFDMLQRSNSDENIQLCLAIVFLKVNQSINQSIHQSCLQVVQGGIFGQTLSPETEEEREAEMEAA